MSSKINTKASAKPAPWRSDFLETLSKMDSPEFVLSSLTTAPSSSNSPTQYLPRVRFCIFRGFWAELPENKHNTAEKNPRVYESDLPTFTSDVRMEKVGQLFGTSAGKAESDDQVQGSGGGGPIEAAFWIKDEGVQWRIKGNAYIVSTDMEEDNDGQGRSGVKAVKSQIGERMRVAEGMVGKEGEWSWEKEVTGHFGNLSPGMRGTFKAPPPGQPLDKPYDKQNLELGTKVEELHHEVARKNFRVAIIKADEVEKLFLADPTKAQRWRWTFNRESNEWKEEELWP